MSNKQQLQTNNIDLSTILTTIGDLPIKALVEAAASQGAYVWKKSEKVTIDFVNPTFDGIGSNGAMTVSNASFDLSAVNSQNYVEFFNGFVSVSSANGTSFSFAKTGSDLYFSDKKVESYENNALYIPGMNMSGVTMLSSFNGTKTLDSTIHKGYVVSNNESAYPDGGTQDGYYYARVSEGVTGIDFGEVTVSSTTDLTVSHNLATIPSKVMLIQKNVSNYGTGYNIAQMYPVWNGSYDNGYLRAYGYLSGGYTSTSTIGDGSTVIRTDTTITFPGSFKGAYIWIALV